MLCTRMVRRGRRDCERIVVDRGGCAEYGSDDDSTQVGNIGECLNVNCSNSETSIQNVFIIPAPQGFYKSVAPM